MIFRDPIIEALYAVRKKLLEECQDDLRELARRQQKVELPAGMRLVSIDEAQERQRLIDAAYDAAISAGS